VHSRSPPHQLYKIGRANRLLWNHRLLDATLLREAAQLVECRFPILRPMIGVAASLMDLVGRQQEAAQPLPRALKRLCGRRFADIILSTVSSSVDRE
jgi:hypothetical protein